MLYLQYTVAFHTGPDSKRQPGHHYTYRASTHVQQLSDNQQRRLEAETTHEREERLQQLPAAQVRS